MTANASWLLMPEASSLLENSDKFETLLDAARKVRKNAYAPYSNFKVGVAVLMGGEIYAGCNVENASYGAAICAERSAIFTGIAGGARVIEALALTTGNANRPVLTLRHLPASDRRICRKSCSHTDRRRCRLRRRNHNA